MEQPKEWGRYLRIFRERTKQSLDDMVDSVSEFNDLLTEEEKAGLRSIGAESYLTVNKSTLSRYEKGEVPPHNRGRIILLIFYFRKLGSEVIVPQEADTWLDLLGFAMLRDEEYRVIFGNTLRQKAPRRVYEEQVIDFSDSLEGHGQTPVLEIPKGAQDIVVRREGTGTSLRIILGFIIPVVSLALLLALLYFNPKVIEVLKGLIFPPTATPTVMPVETPSPQITPADTLTPTSDTITPTATLTVTVAPSQPQDNATPVSASGAAVSLRAVSTPINITGSPGNSMLARIAFDGEGRLHLAWEDNTLRKGDGYDILEKVKQYDGAWSETTNLTEGFESIRDTLKFVRRPDGVLCMFWHGATVNAAPSTNGLYMRCYIDGRWNKAEQLHYGLAVIYDPVFAQDGSPQWVYSAAPRFVRFGDIDLADGLKNVSLARMAIDTDGGYHITWRREGDPKTVEYRYSADAGKTWTEAVDIGDPSLPPNSELWMQADSQGRVHLLWDAAGHWLVYRLWTADNGWNPIEKQTFSQLILNLKADLDQDERVQVIWSNNQEVDISRQLEDGSWTAPQAIADSEGVPPFPNIAIGDNGTLHVVWLKNEDAQDYYYAEVK